MADSDCDYVDQVRSFDHTAIAALEAYPALRQALSTIADQLENVSLDSFLSAVRDMAATTPYADTCDNCGGSEKAWPHRAEVHNGWLRGGYRCPRCGHTWICGYAVDLPARI